MRRIAQLVAIAAPAITVLGQTALQQYVPPTVTIFNDWGQTGSHLPAYAVDGNLARYFKGKENQLGNKFQLDLQSSKSIASFYMQKEEGGSCAQPTYKVYIGDQAHNGDMALNHDCANNGYSGKNEGMVNCEATGQYIIWELTNNDKPCFHELRVYDQKDHALGGTADMDPAVTIGEGTVSRLNRAQNIHKWNCMHGTVTGNPRFYVDVSWGSGQSIQTVIVFQGQQGAGYFSQIKVGVPDASKADGVDPTCGTEDWKDNVLEQKVLCQTGFNSITVMRVSFELTGSQFKGLCNISAFGQDCSQGTAGAAIDGSWTQSTVQYKLHDLGPLEIDLPTLSGLPSFPCYTTTWQLLKSSDGTDLVAEADSVYTIEGTKLKIQVNRADYDKRKSLHGQHTVKFKATLNADSPSTVDTIPFIIEYTDTCMTTTINAQSLPQSTFTYGSSGSSTIPFFTDTAGESTSWYKGACGYKDITLNASSPSSLSVKVNNQITGGHTLSFDHTKAVEADIKTHTIAYTVDLRKFKDVVSSISGTFNVIIQCNSTPVTTITSPTPDQTYDILSGAPMTLTGPTLTLTPATCTYTISSYDIVFVQNNALASYISISGTTITVNTQDASTAGVKNHKIKAILDNGTIIGEHTFKLTMEHNCAPVSATLTETLFNPAVTNYDLLEEKQVQVALPSVSIAPASCNFGITWKVQRTSDDKDMSVTSPENMFQLTATHLTIQFEGNCFERHDYYGLQSYYFIGTVADNTNTQTSKFTFVVNFTDECRTTQLQPTTGTLIHNPIFSVDSTKQVVFLLPFADTYAGTTYKCGGRRLSLVDAEAYPFLSIPAPRKSPSLTQNILYTDSQALPSQVDIEYEIKYNVQLNCYQNIVPALQGSFKLKILCPSVLYGSSITTPTKFVNFYDVANPDKLLIELPLIKLEPSACFNVTDYEFHIKDQPLNVPSFIKVSKNKLSFEVSTNDRLQLGNHPITVIAVTSSNQKVQGHDFWVDISDSCISATIKATNPIGEIKVQALSETILEKTFSIATDSVTEGYKSSEKLCGEFQYKLLDENLEPAPPFMKLEYLEGDSYFVIATDSRNIDTAVTLNFVVQVELKDYLKVAQPLQEAFQLTVESTESFVFDQTEEEQEPDREPQPVPIVEPEPQPQPEVDPTPPVIWVPPQKVVTDIDRKADKIRAQVNPNQEESPEPVAYIRQTTQDGLVFVQFSERMKKLPSDIDLKTLQFEAKPDQWQNSFTVDLLLSQESQLLDDDSVNSERRRLQSANGNLQDHMTWSLLHQSTKQLLIQLEFDQPLLISYIEPDSIGINFNDENLFISEDGIKIAESSRNIVRQITRQLPNEAKELQEGINKQASNCKVSTLIVLGVNTVLGAGLQSVFSMINALQIIIMLPLFEASVPPNAGQVFGYLAEIAAFDVIEISEYVDEYLELIPTEPVNSKLEVIGFESRQFINNVGFFLFYITLCSIGIALWLIAVPASKIIPRLAPLRLRLDKLLFWNRLIQAIFESFLIVTFSGLIAFKYKFIFSSEGSRVQSFYALGCFIAYIGIPLYCLVRVSYNFSLDYLNRFEGVFGQLYEGLILQKGRIVLLEPILFLIRRVFLAVMVIYGTRIFMIQFILLTLSNMLITVITFQLVKKPKMYMFAELSIVIVSDCFIAFNVVKPEFNFVLGYMTIGIIGLYILVCAIIIFSKIFIVSRRQLRRMFAMWSYKKYRKQLHLNLHAMKAQRRNRIRQLRRPENGWYDSILSQSEIMSLSSSHILSSNSSDSSYESSSDSSSSSVLDSGKLVSRAHIRENGLITLLDGKENDQIIRKALQQRSKDDYNSTLATNEPAVTSNGLIKGNIPINMNLVNKNPIKASHAELIEMYSDFKVDSLLLRRDPSYEATLPLRTITKKAKASQSTETKPEFRTQQSVEESRVISNLPLQPISKEELLILEEQDFIFIKSRPQSSQQKHDRKKSTHRRNSFEQIESDYNQILSQNASQEQTQQLQVPQPVDITQQTGPTQQSMQLVTQTANGTEERSIDIVITQLDGPSNQDSQGHQRNISATLKQNQVQSYAEVAKSMPMDLLIERQPRRPQIQPAKKAKASPNKKRKKH